MEKISFSVCGGEEVAGERLANLLEKAGLDVVYPTGLRGLCCGQPFVSKGMMSDAENKLREMCVCISLLCRCPSLQGENLFRVHRENL
jgi:hypothetical protein